MFALEIEFLFILKNTKETTASHGVVANNQTTSNLFLSGIVSKFWELKRRPLRCHTGVVKVEHQSRYFVSKELTQAPQEVLQVKIVRFISSRILFKRLDLLKTKILHIPLIQKLLIQVNIGDLI